NGPAIALPVPNRDREREARGTAQDLRLESSIRRRGRLAEQCVDYDGSSHKEPAPARGWTSIGHARVLVNCTTSLPCHTADRPDGHRPPFDGLAGSFGASVPARLPKDLEELRLEKATTRVA